MGNTIHQGDALEMLKALDANSLDSMVTDPPAGISFMGKAWDGDKGGRNQWIAWLSSVMVEALRVLKPGAHALVWALPRTSHWTATAIEDAGFEIRDVVTHHFGSGFPKSLDVSKAIDSSVGAVREVVGVDQASARRDGRQGESLGRQSGQTGEITAPATDAAKQWNGWGTALKPASEHWILARKPLIGTVAANVLEHGTGGINVDGCRVGTTKDIPASPPKDRIGQLSKGDERGRTDQTSGFDPNVGRWPPNLLLTHAATCAAECAPCCPVREIGAQGKGSRADIESGSGNRGDNQGGYGGYDNQSEGCIRHGGTGAARFFPTFRYTPKPSTAEREKGVEHKKKQSAGELTGGRKEGSAGLDNPRAGAGRTSNGRANTHPTVKPIALMQWLCRLITPPGGKILDPFCGSGTTGIAALREGFSFTGIELDADYAEIARSRIIGDSPLFNRVST